MVYAKGRLLRNNPSLFIIVLVFLEFIFTSVWPFSAFNSCGLIDVIHLITIRSSNILRFIGCSSECTSPVFLGRCDHQYTMILLLSRIHWGISLPSLFAGPITCPSIYLLKGEFFCYHKNSTTHTIHTFKYRRDLYLIQWWRCGHSNLVF